MSNTIVFTKGFATIPKNSFGPERKILTVFGPDDMQIAQFDQWSNEDPDKAADKMIKELNSLEIPVGTELSISFDISRGSVLNYNPLKRSVK